MTRQELARWLRNQANGMQEPLLDGTDLTKSERVSLNMIMAKLSGAAYAIEASNAADKAACAKIYSGEVFSYGE